jgi:choline kinase
MNKRFIILAGNKNFDTRWNNHLGTSKHMIPIKGEPLIHRTQRLLLDRNQKDIIITCNKDNIGKYNLSNVTAIESKNNKSHIYPDYEFATTEGLLNPDGITIMLWGDLYLSENIINKIVNNNSEDWHFYGRRKSSEITGSIYGEDFGWYFNNNHILNIMSTSETMLPILKKLVKDQSLYPWAMEDCSKMLYRMMAKIDYEDPHLIDKHHWIEIDDETEDFDYPEDWTKWSERLPHLAF